MFLDQGKVLQVQWYRHCVLSCFCHNQSAAAMELAAIWLSEQLQHDRRADHRPIQEAYIFLLE